MYEINLAELSRLVATQNASVESVAVVFACGIVAILAVALVLGVFSRATYAVRFRILDWRLSREDAYRYELKVALSRMAGLGINPGSVWALARRTALARVSLTGRLRVWTADRLNQVSRAVGGL